MLGDSYPDLSLAGATLPSCAIRPSDSRLIPRRSRLDSSPGMPERLGLPTTSVFDSSRMRWLPGRAIRPSPCRGPVSTSSMPSTPGSGVRPLAVGLTWRREVSAQVFEEAAVDLGRALAAYGKANSGTLQEHRSGFPRRKRKGHCRDSFRMRNRISRNGRCHIRIGEGHARTILLPTIGVVRVHDDTRRLRRLLRPVEHRRPLTGSSALTPRARVLFATVARHGHRWLISLNVEAPDLHTERRHHPPSVG
jgi:hypothetical protein